MPLTDRFADTLQSVLPDLLATYPTPFHLYDARGIAATHDAMVAAFAGVTYRQHFAVKATPNPHVLGLLHGRGSGLDCSSGVELALAHRVGARGEEVVFTSNNTPLDEYHRALRDGAVITFDDVSLLDRVEDLPELVAFRVAPNGPAAGSALMGGPAHSKFGVPVESLVDAYRRAWARGVRRFGIHGMTCANELDADRASRAAVDVVDLGAHVASTLGIELEYVNIGGGLGLPYRPEERPVDIDTVAGAVTRAVHERFPVATPRVLSEYGRYVTGPHGVVVSRVVSRSEKAQTVIGLDASMSSLMRPAMYGAYHHISLPFAGDRPLAPYDVVGSMCENMDKFAEDRPLPDPREGDVVLLHDTGAHGHAMGFTYNGRLRPAELMVGLDGGVVEIRRAETVDDYLSTVRTPAVGVRAAPREAVAAGAPR